MHAPSFCLSHNIWIAISNSAFIAFNGVMTSCRCSTRALELFIKDVSGLSLRRQRPQLQRTIRSSRNFGTRPPFRQLENVQSASVQDDGFIPFEFERTRNARSTTSAKDKDGVLDDEWHAELEIAESWPRGTKDQAAAQQEGVVYGASSSDAAEVGKDGNQEEHLHEDASNRPMQESTAKPSTEASSEPAKSKAQSRLERKLRRMDAGMYHGRKTQHEGKPQTSVEQMASVLKRIEALETPKSSTIENKPDAVSKAPGKQSIKPTKQAHPRAKRLPRRNKAPTELQRGTMSEARDDQQTVLSLSDVIEHDAAAVDPGAVLPEPARKKKPRHRDRAKEASPSATEQEELKISSPTKVSNPKNNTTKHEQPKHEPAPQEPWGVQKEALLNKFGEQGWQPRKRLSPDSMSGIRALHASDPAAYNTEMLAEHFKITPEAIRRILRGKWRPNELEAEDRRIRWERRGVRKWGEMAASGVRPPQKWRRLGVSFEKKGVRERRLARGGSVGSANVEGDVEVGGESLDERIL